MKLGKLAWIHFITVLIATVVVILWMQWEDYSLASVIRMGSYLFFLNLITSILIGNQMSDQNLSLKRRIGEGWMWPVRWHIVVAILGLLGGCLGSLLFLIVGTLFDIGEGMNERLLNGFKDGLYYFLLWSPGGSIILLIIWKHKQNKKSK